MDDVALRALRLRAHRLTAPAADPVAAAGHMLAVQSQEFWGGRWALAVRSRGAPTLRDLDRAFDDGALVRSWTQRGTIHTLAAADLGWMLALTAARQFRLAAGRLRQLELDEDVFRAAERLAVAALGGGGRLTRAEFAALLEGAGIATAGQRGIHVLQVLHWRGVLCHGPVVPRAGGVTREQYLVATADWIPDAAIPVDPAAEAFARFVDGHGPATVRDFAWWSGLTLAACREAAAGAGDRVRIVGDDPEPRYVSVSTPRARADAPAVIALPPFDEYYIACIDRDRVCDPARQRVVGPGANGMVSPIVLADGVVVGRWTHSRALGARGAAPAEVFDPAEVPDEAVTAALDRYAAFVAG
ncbi:winged helix DNA-binding domain-containing protein [Microbacterium sp. GXF7504]